MEIQTLDPLKTSADTDVSKNGHFAIEGGEPIVRGARIMGSRWPLITQDDVEELVATFRSGLLTEMSGRNRVQAFEREISTFVGTNFALTTNSGTAALHCALAGVGVESGDEVIVPALTYIGCAAAVLHQQAIPIFVDVHPYTYNMSPELVEARITERTKAIMVVHLHGLPAPMDAFMAIGKRYGIPVIEDFSQAFGASYKGRRVGSIGDVGAASLMAGKNLPSAGEAGIVVTNNREVRNRAATLKCFAEKAGYHDTYTTLHETCGWNYRSNIISLAFASRQLERVDKLNGYRAASAVKLNAVLRELPGFSPPVSPPDANHVYHMYRFRFDPKLAGLSVSADQAHEALKQIFWNEGLPLIEFQNVPLPGHALLQKKVGYGKGCPWSCHQREDVVYNIDDYPGSLDVIRHTLVVGYPAQAPLVNQDLVDHYARGFRKIQQNIEAFERFAASLPSNPPWQTNARLF